MKQLAPIVEEQEKQQQQASADDKLAHKRTKSTQETAFGRS
jgi:hypothetical protein